MDACSIDYPVEDKHLNVISQETNCCYKLTMTNEVCTSLKTPITIIHRLRGSIMLGTSGLHKRSDIVFLVTLSLLSERIIVAKKAHHKHNCLPSASQRFQLTPLSSPVKFIIIKNHRNASSSYHRKTWSRGGALSRVLCQMASAAEERLRVSATMGLTDGISHSMQTIVPH